MQQREQLTGILSARPARFGPSMVMQVMVRIEQAEDSELVPDPLPPDYPYNPQQWDREQRMRISRAWKTVRVEWRDATYEDMRELGFVTSVDQQFKHINDCKEN